MSDQNLNQDAVEAAAKRFYGLHGKGAWDALWDRLHPRVRAEYCTQIEDIVGSYLAALPAQHATSSQPDENAMRAAVEAVLNEAYGNHGELAGIAVRAYLDASPAQPDTVNSLEELDGLPQETVIRSVVFGVTRERMESGWMAMCDDEYKESSEIAGRDHVVLYRPAVNS